MIRRANHDDLQELWKLDCSTFPKPYPYEKWLGLLEDGEIYVAMHDDRIVGSCVVRDDQLVSLGVHPDMFEQIPAPCARRQGTIRGALALKLPKAFRRHNASDAASGAGTR
jgi:hypothetical protein